MDYKVGDKVEIISFQYFMRHKYEIMLTQLMTKFCGKIATITKVNKERWYKIDLDDEVFNWKINMFKNDINQYNMEKRTLEIDIETAKKLYNCSAPYLKEMALKAFTEEELSKKEIKTWDDLIKYKIPAEGYWLSTEGTINQVPISYAYIFSVGNKNLFFNEKYAKSALAMAQISQLIPYYGGAITDEEWCDDRIEKFYLYRNFNKILKGNASIEYHSLAFHTSEQRDLFLENNEQLVKDYFMLE